MCARNSPIFSSCAPADRDRERRRADQPRVVAQLGPYQPGAVDLVAGVILPVEDVPYRGHQGLPLGGGSSADAEYLRLKDIDQAGHAAAQVADILVDDLPGGGVPQGGGVKGRAAVDPFAPPRQLPQLGIPVRLHRLPGALDQGGGGAIGFQTSAPPAGAGTSVVLNDEVPHLQPGVVEAGVELPIQHRAAAHAGPQRNGHHGRAALAHPGGIFPQGGGICVVFQVNLFVQPRFQQRRQRHVPEIQIGPVFHYPLSGLDGAGRAHAHRGDLLPADPRVHRRRMGRGGHGVGHRLHPPGRGQAGPAQDRPRVIHHGGGHIGAAQINTQIVHTPDLLLFLSLSIIKQSAGPHKRAGIFS